MANAELKVRFPSFSAAEMMAARKALDEFFSGYVEKYSKVDVSYSYPVKSIGREYLPLYWGVPPSSPEVAYDLTLDGKAYIMAVISFNPLLKAEPHCITNDSALPNGHCEWIARRRSVCHVFLLEPKSFDLQAVAALNVERDPRLLPGKKSRTYQDIDEKIINEPRQLEGWPACNKLLAVGSVKGGANSLLLSIGYKDSAAPANKSEDEYVLRMTVKLDFLKDDEGRVKIVQDDACLGNPNTYATISAARAILSSCGAKNR